VWEALVAGRIDVRRARVLAHGTCHLPEDTARAVVEEIIDRAPGLATGQLAARLRRLCMEADPDEATRHYDQAVEERRVVAEPTETGTANLFGLDLPPDRVAQATARINHMARSLRGDGEARTMDQLRADILLDLLCGTDVAQSGGGRGMVDLHIDLTTLAELTNHPGELAGMGPVIADVARQIARRQFDAEWRYTVTDPQSGQPIHTGTTRRRPTRGQQRTVEARDRTCVFPGCRMPARDADLDHRQPFTQGGPTEVDNLVPLCRHDHRIRHQAGWAHQPLPNGDHQWTTHLGHTYTTSGTPP
jgi:hypothetical protein